jgi:hypothetical protein
MTYYDWINYFYTLQKAPISDEPINRINSSNLEYKGNIKIRFLNHIVKLINIRLNNALDNFLDKRKTLVQDKNNLSIELNELKKEIVFAKKLATTKYFEEDIKNQLISNISNFGEEMNISIKESFQNCNNSEIIMIVNNLDLNA